MQSTEASFTFPSAAGNVSVADPTLHWKEKRDMMRRVWPPFIVLLGVVGNTLTLVLLHGMRKQSMSYLFFMGLAVSDLLILCLGLLPRWIGWQFGFSLADQSPYHCLVLKWAGYSLGTLSAYLLVSVTIYRALAAVLPHRPVKDMCRGKCVTLTMSTGIVVCILQNLHIPFYVDYNATKCVFTDSYYADVIPILTWVYALLFCFLPSIIIFISNVLLVRALVLSHGKVTNTATAHRDHQRRSVTITVITVSFTFLLLTLPTSLVRISQTLNPSLKGNALDFVNEFAKLWWYMNSAVNFYLYICTSRGLRFEFKRRFCSKHVQPGTHTLSRNEACTYMNHKLHSKSEDGHG